MSVPNKGSSGTVAPQDALSYLNSHEQATVLRVNAQRNPTTADRRFKIGTLWINASTNVMWGLASVTSNSANWVLLGPGSSDVDSLTPDGGTSPVVPAGGTITLAGGTNITTVGGLNTMTFNLDAAITLATSVTSPLYTAGAGVDTVVEAVAGQNIVLNMSSNDGSTSVSFTDSDDAEVFAVDSNGGIGTLTSLTVAGAFTQTAGVVNIGQDNAANAINIGGGTTARAIGIGNSAAAHTITLGSVTGAASLDLQYGTGNFTIDGAAGGNITVGDSAVAGVITIGGNAQTGNFVLAPSTDALTATLANNDGAKTINIGNGVDGNTISLGNGINTSAQTINIASGAAAADSTVNIFGGVATAGTQTLNLATGASATAVNIGNTTGATAVVINSGTGSIALTSTGTGDITLDSDDTLLLDADGVLELNSSAGAISIGNDADAQAINIGTGAAARTITLGNATGATSVVVDVGTGNLDLGVTATAHTTTLGSTTGASATTVQAGTGALNVTGGGAINVDAAGQLQINSSGSTIDIGNDDIDQNVNLGTDGERTVTVGSTNGAAALVLQSGTGEITVTGTVKEIDAEFLSRSGDDVTFQASPVMTTAADTGGAPTGATGDVNLMSLQEGIIMEQFILGAGQTIIAPRMDANGLLVSLDLTATEGAEYNFGAARNNSRHAFTIGTSPAFFAEWSFRINDMDGASPYVCGFRKVEANNATFANYTDYAAIGMIAGTSPTNIVTVTELNAGGQTITDTTDAWGGDGSTNTLRVLVDASGNVTYTINGAAPSASAAFQFDNTDVVVPFFRLEHSASPTEVEWVSMKIGFQA
jgi:hypothetical protein